MAAPPAFIQTLTGRQAIWLTSPMGPEPVYMHVCMCVCVLFLPSRAELPQKVVFSYIMCSSIGSAACRHVCLASHVIAENHDINQKQGGRMDHYEKTGVFIYLVRRDF